MPNQILMVVTAADALTLADGSEHPTGYWVSEVAEPDEVLTGAGFDVVFATPGGVTPVPDGRSMDQPGAQEALEHLGPLFEPHALSGIEDVTRFAAVVLPGGHGPMADLARDSHLGRILRDAVRARVAIAAICHGPAGLLSAEQSRKGGWPFAGLRMTAFSDAEEGDLAGRLAYSLEQVLRGLGGNVEVADEPFAEHVVVDDLLVTGQNPSSARGAAQALVDLLHSQD
jgi:putative intracellular protease/amidase